MNSDLHHRIQVPSHPAQLNVNAVNKRLIGMGIRCYYQSIAAETCSRSVQGE
jgi:hypothetical protein